MECFGAGDAENLLRQVRGFAFIAVLVDDAFDGKGFARRVWGENLQRIADGEAVPHFHEPASVGIFFLYDADELAALAVEPVVIGIIAQRAVIESR